MIGGGRRGGRGGEGGSEVKVRGVANAGTGVPASQGARPGVSSSSALCSTSPSVTCTFSSHFHSPCKKRLQCNIHSSKTNLPIFSASQLVVGPEFMSEVNISDYIWHNILFLSRIKKIAQSHEKSVSSTSCENLSDVFLPCSKLQHQSDILVIL